MPSFFTTILVAVADPFLLPQIATQPLGMIPLVVYSKEERILAVYWDARRIIKPCIQAMLDTSRIASAAHL